MSGVTSGPAEVSPSGVLVGCDIMTVSAVLWQRCTLPGQLGSRRPKKKKKKGGGGENNEEREERKKRRKTRSRYCHIAGTTERSIVH